MMRKKNSFLNKNSIPFLLLVFVHFFAFLILLKRKNHKNTWFLLLTNIGLAYLFEYITLNVLHGYRYKPAMMKNRFFDAVLGAILSQGIYVPIASTFLTTFKKNWKWKISTSFIYFSIELLFLRLRIYKVFWWKPLYTLVFLNLYFYISDVVYKALSIPKRWALLLAYYFSQEVISVTLMFIYAAKQQFRFGRGRFHTWTEHFIIVPLYSLALTAIATFTASKSGIYNRLIMLGSHVLIDKALIRIGLLKMKFKYSFGAVIWYLSPIFICRFLYKSIYDRSE
jgi:hypothetical protein